MMKRVSAIRWEGNNILSLRDWLAALDFAALIETDGTRAVVRIVHGQNSLFEIVLNDGDGLLWDGELLGTARNMVYSSEIAAEEEWVH